LKKGKSKRPRSTE